MAFEVECLDFPAEFASLPLPRKGGTEDPSRVRAWPLTARILNLLSTD